jgi:hypothetical protein
MSNTTEQARQLSGREWIRCYDSILSQIKTIVGSGEGFIDFLTLDHSTDIEILRTKIEFRFNIISEEDLGQYRFDNTIHPIELTDSLWNLVSDILNPQSQRPQ